MHFVEKKISLIALQLQIQMIQTIPISTLVSAMSKAGGNIEFIHHN